MEIETLSTLVSILIILSVASERLVEIIKRHYSLLRSRE